MPGSSRTQQKAEAKYNVTTEFPRLDLHSAAASGNLGLVKFAISHGQPINSVLDGVLPLHAASAGGSEVVVRYLITMGADVNAQRLPRRYSNEKTRHTIVGTSGSTPLHFAAANGQLGIIRILLEHGAHPDRADKHGVKPEMLARDCGHADCADLLKTWQSELEDDLPPPSDVKPAEIHEGYFASLPPGSKRLQVKRSIDTALHKIKSHHHHHSSSPLPPIHTSTPEHDADVSVTQPLGEYTFYPTSPTEIDEKSQTRRPSLPHIYDAPPVPIQRHSSDRSIHRSSRRPSSAGNGAEQANSPNDSNCPPRRLANKISLLNLFKKANGESSSGYVTPERESLSRQSSATDPTEPRPSQTSFTYSPALGARSIPPTPPSPADLPLPLEDTGSSTAAGYTTAPSYGPGRFRSRLGSEVGTPSPLAISSTDLPRALSRERLRARSSSRASSSGIHDSEDMPTSPGSRPGILRGLHNRSSSNQSNAPGTASSRILRFDSSASNSAVNVNSVARPYVGQQNVRTASRSPAPAGRLRMASSVSSLRHQQESGRANGSLEGAEQEQNPMPESAPALTTEFEGGEKYQQTPFNRHPHLTIDVIGRSRGQSFTSSCSSLSPVGNVVTSGVTISEFNAEDGERGAESSIITPMLTEEPDKLVVPHQVSSMVADDKRMRGESVSSTDTTSSTTAPSQSSGTSGSYYTNLSLSSILPSSASTAHGIDPRKKMYTHREHESSVSSLEDDLDGPVQLSTVPVLRGDKPTIDLRSVSNHAEAEALVQQTQKEILELASMPEDDPNSPGLNRMPLSAQLAAYGEMLALERRFAKGEKQREQWANRSESDGEVEPSGNVSPRSVSSFARDGRFATSPPGRTTNPRGNLASPPRSAKATTIPRRTRRPHTAEGRTTPAPSMLGDKPFAPSTSGSNASHFGTSLRPRHVPTRSVSSPVDVQAQNVETEKNGFSDVKIVEISATPIEPSRLGHSHHHHTHVSESAIHGLFSPRLPRSRTPDAELPRVSVDIAPPSDSTFGISLSRCSTAPLQNSTNINLNDPLLMPQRGGATLPRHSGSVNKLTRMGFSPSQSQIHLQQLQQRSASTSTNSSAASSVTRSPTKQRFGGIRSLVQSLKGK